MRLKKLELYGFKSFAQRTEIVFNEGITGIVGPNGSGKSNIGDAVRWVLGEQSARTLRGASMQDVIFGGTQSRKPMSYCEVSLVFDNEDRSLPLDYAEIAVTRRVYRNGDSEYYLNRSACRLKDVIDLFRDTGIGKEGYSIIGQGRIDDILSRKGEDRRVVFEEAAGIVKYRARKEEADRKLEHTLDNMSRVDDLMDELKRQLGPLEEQAKNAREYLDLSDELKDLDLNLFLVRTDRMNARLAELDNELIALRDVVAHEDLTLQEKNRDTEKQQDEIATLEEKVAGARDGLMACADRVHRIESARGAIEVRRETRGENRTRLMQESMEAEERLGELEQLARQNEDDAEQGSRVIQKAEEALQALQQQAADAKDAETAAENVLEEHKAAVMAAINRLAGAKNDQTRLTTMQSAMTDRLKELEASLKTMEEMLAAARAARGEADGMLAAETALQEQLSGAYQGKKRELEASDGDLVRLRGEFDRKKQDLQALESRAKLLREMTAEMEGYSQSVRKAVQYAQNRGIPGVRGVLAQLIRVPKQYETAVDMVLGASQQNIVTEDEETAKELINYLREGKLGRATFLPMTSVRGKSLEAHERRILSMDGCLGVASDLVECDGAYREIVENLLGRTVIATDLDHGIPIMRACGHSVRLVTLNGDVMHSGGSMTGGSSRGQMVSLLGRARELKEAEDKVTAWKTELNDLQAQLIGGQTRKEELKKETADALEALHQQEIAVARENERAGQAAEEEQAAEERLAATRDAMDQLRESLEDIGNRLAAAGSITDEQQTDRAEMEEKTKELQSALLQARNVSSAAAESVVAATLKLNDLKHEASELSRDRTRFGQEQERLRKDQERRLERLGELDRQENEDLTEAASLDSSLETGKLEQERQDRIVQSLEERRKKLQDQLKELLRDTEALHQSLNRDQEKVHRTELTRSRAETDLKTLQERIWNTYEMTYAMAEEFRRTEGFSESKADRRASELMVRIRALGVVNVRAVEEYADVKQRYDAMSVQREDLLKAEKDLRELIAQLLSQMKETFVENFTRLQGYFSETFVSLFGGGSAQLTLTDPSDPLNCPIEINAQPPGKKLQLLSLLSGGERTLTAIAILFATLKLKPTPFCLLDEIEAALDDANIGYYADYLADYSKSTQFVVITHRKGTMERCNNLYGVAMEEQGVSRMVSVSLQDYKE